MSFHNSDSKIVKDVKEKPAFDPRLDAKEIPNEIKADLVAKYKRSDTDIAQAVVNVISWDVGVPEGAVKVSVEDGHVTLTGKVNWWYQRHSAEKAIYNLMGVKSVNNQISIYSYSNYC